MGAQMPFRSEVETRLREQKAVQLKLAGLTYQAIADTPMLVDGKEVFDDDGNVVTLYKTPTGARDAIMRVLHQEQTQFMGNVEDVRALELSRLDRLYQAAFARAMRDGNKSDSAIQSCLKIAEHRRQLIGGLSVPQKVEMDVSGDEMTAAALSVLAEIKAKATSPPDESQE